MKVNPVKDHVSTLKRRWQGLYCNQGQGTETGSQYPQPAAAAAETVKETAPVAVTPQTEAVAETSAEEKHLKKRTQTG